MFVSNDEETFFFSFLKDDLTVLEYGSGKSTTQISQKVKHLVSVEHQKQWFEEVIKAIPKNCSLMLKEPSELYIEGGQDGSYSQFKDYIEAPIEQGPYDIIFIDGRARVGCASVCHLMSHENTHIFIHDFHRPEYQEALKYLELKQRVGEMALFKIKKND
jgi:hypothetical protein